MKNKPTCNSVAFELGNFYTLSGSYMLYRYVGMYGQKRVFMRYGYDCTDRTGIWYYRCRNAIQCTKTSYDRAWLPVSIDLQGRFTLCGNIECELLHNLYEFEVIK